MKVLTPGHKYLLDAHEGRAHQTIQFIEKRKEGDALVTVNDGTTNEEVLRMLINRIDILNTKLPCEENEVVLANLRASLEILEQRTAKRQARGVEGTPKP